MTSRQCLIRVKGQGTPYEKHHIVPRAVGGSDDPENVVLLTPREHYMAHLLLVRFTSGQDRARMAYALHMMCQNNPNQSRIACSRHYENARKSVSVFARGANHPSYGSRRTAEQKAAISVRMTGAGNPRYRQKPWNIGLTVATSPELRKAGETYRATLKQRPELLQNRHMSEEAKQKIGDALRGRPKSDVHRQKISATLTGRTMPPDVLLKIGAALKGKPHKIVMCPHCGVSGGAPAMARGHFDQCGEVKERVPQKRPSLSLPATCPHCGKTGATGPMKQWHFNNCREKT